MAGPIYSVTSRAIQGAVWPGKFGLQPSIKKAKRSKEGKYEKDAEGKQIYSEFYSKNDLLDLQFVARRLHDYLMDNPEPKKDDVPF